MNLLATIPGRSADKLGRMTEKASFSILFSLSVAHFLHDILQSIVPSIYPILKRNYQLNFIQIGCITLTFQVMISLLQPLVGSYTDRRPMPYLLTIGMCFTLIGVVGFAISWSFIAILCSVGIIGIGSAIFHPESSRLARLVSGGRYGVAQSFFQIGGNTGTAMGSLLVAIVVTPMGQFYSIWFSLLALLGAFLLWKVGNWCRKNLFFPMGNVAKPSTNRTPLPQRKTNYALAILLILIFSKYFYLASMKNYYTFYLINKFHISIQAAQFFLFLFLFSVAVGILIGGIVSDRVGTKYVIWISILGVTPFTIFLPYVDLFWTISLSMLIGIILSSAFSAIIVYAQNLVPGKVGRISGLFYGFAFGMGGIGAALLGVLADRTSIYYMYQVCSFLPLIGLLAGFLPKIDGKREKDYQVQLIRN